MPPLPGLSAPTCWLPKMGAWLSSEPRSVPQAGGLGPEAWACLPGQGLRYLEHLCLVLEQMARLQQLCLQLQTQRPPRVSELQAGRPVGGRCGGGRGGPGPLEPALELGLECPSVLCAGS